MIRKITEKFILKKLEEVLDPEINISIVDLGLIYQIKLRKKNPKVLIKMTLTTIGCPLFSLIEDKIIDKMKELGFKRNEVRIELVFDPPWSIERVTKKGRAILGI